MGSKGSNTTTQNQTQTYSANPAIQQAGYQALNMATNAANQPFQQPVAPVAGFSGQQQQAFQQYGNITGTAQPYYNTANNLYQQSAAPVTAQDVSNYYNPMANSVTAQLQNIYGQQNQQNTANLVQAAGGVGADRIAVGQANMANQQDLAAGQTYANLYQQALQAAQTTKQQQANAASGLAGLGNTAQNSALQGANALYQSGLYQQQQSQAQQNATYQNQLAQIAYPFQTAQYLAGITGGLSGALGGTTTGQSQTTTPSPSIWSQLLGLGVSGVGVAGSLGAFGGSPSYGGGSAFSGDAYGGSAANPLPGLTAADYGAGYADGGGVSDEPLDESKGFIPSMQVQSGSGQAHNNLHFSQPQAQSNSNSGLSEVLSAATKILPMMKDGGTPHYDDGGDVPGTNIPGSPSFDPSSPISGVPVPMQAPWPFNKGHTVMGGNGTIVPGGPIYSGVPTPAASANTASPFPTTQQSPVPFAGVTGQRPTPSFPRPALAAKPAPANGAAGTASTPADNSDSTDSNLPYPDATKRDWGQDAARSPWLALVEAGATMAATPGPLGSAIGKGLLAGAKTLQEERKQGQSEAEINQKAQALMETAKEHLKKWNSMTPYERASIAARNRELDQEETGVSGKPGKFTGADYDRAAKFVQSMNPGLSPEQLQPLIDAEVARRRRVLAAGTSAAPATGIKAGDTAANASPDPGEGKREKGKWYIGPTGNPQQWLG